MIREGRTRISLIYQCKDTRSATSTGHTRASSACGFVHPGNRQTQEAFRYPTCGHTENADLNASRNIAVRAAVNRPGAVCSPTHGGEVESQACKEHGTTYGSMPPTRGGGS
ncbi:zinc ribbon domain-containing protein [Methanoculleus sp.]|uniref:zinc ribbon domain-containing protein n=1 Tax=Methanoculleus sp. TaxID=90427 RepID=UPI003FA5571E